MLNSSNGSYNSFNNGGNNSSDEKQRTNFSFGKLKQSDGRLDVGIWVNQYGISAKFIIRQQCGKDPSTGANLYENKSPADLPQGFLDREKMRLFIDIIEENKYQNLNFKLPGNTTIAVASEGNNVKITLNNTKNNENRTITLEGTNVDGKIFNAPLRTLVSWMKVAYRKSLVCRIEEFDENAGASEEMPF